MNRYTGDIFIKPPSRAAGGGPGLGTKRAYVPMVTGMVMAYRLEPVTDAARELHKIDPNAGDMTDDEKKKAAAKAEEERRENIRIRQDYVPPLACSSAGRALVAPVVTTQTPDEERVAWVTDRGYLYLGRIDRRSEDVFLAKHRVSTKGTFSSPPAYLPPLPPDPEKKRMGDSGVIYAGSSDGYLYAVSERNGEELWKFPAGEAIIDSPVVIENRVFTTTELGGMFCLNATTGKQLWHAPDIMHFVAEGKRRVYAADKLGRLVILSARSGAMLESLPTSVMPIKISNGQTDRIYLATEEGLIQCCARWTWSTPSPTTRASPAALGRGTVQKRCQKLRPKSNSDAPKVAHRSSRAEKPGQEGSRQEGC